MSLSYHLYSSTLSSFRLTYSGAVHQVLLREGDEVTGLEGVSTFGGSGGGERPAASALALVLDGCHDVLASPVNGGVVVVSYVVSLKVNKISNVLRKSENE